MWQEAWRLIRHDLQRAWWNYLLVMVLSLFFGAWTTLMLRGLTTGYSPDRYLLDFYFLAVVPIIGCPWYTGKYSERTQKQLRFYRSLPISVSGVVLSRILTVVLRAVSNALVMFGALYAFSPELRAMLTPLEFLWFALIWFGYGLALSLWYTYWEMNSGSQLKFWLYSSWYVVLWVGMCLLWWLVFDVLVLSSVIELARSFGWVAGLGSLVLGGLVTVYWWKLAKSNLEKRPLF
ncbi:hypothetical protein CIG75_19955 [Tumebacillus algifaecis]|uniref:Uncharacterized protein n=1 Tax=Tumebacillus algifaecis TaxID=1214604 RepID=A0A223D699_9BACL|nr:hypothetical protein [Tumebacillus algifaecis]ASS76963.1 hypothetical protein CIG75_19955 [Tumebacillus algifaecis]